MKIGLSIIFASMVLVVLEGFASYKNQTFFPNQVMTRWGKKGIAFFAHGGMWGDFFLLPPLMTMITVNHADEWNLQQVVGMAFMGFVITLINHLLLIYTQVIPDPIGWQKETWSLPIALHFIYMNVYVALVGLFYLFSTASKQTVVIVSVLLGLHVLLGTHVPLGIAQRWKKWHWCPELLVSSALVPLNGSVWIILAALSSVAAGFESGLSVLSVGIILMATVIRIAEMSPSAE